MSTINENQLSAVTPWMNIPLATGWSAFGGAFFTPQFRMKSGELELRGVIKNTSGASASGTMGTVPDGFRPLATTINKGLVQGANARIDVDSSGNIILNSGNAANNTNYVSIDNIRVPLD